jgi:hypothetical protein
MGALLTTLASSGDNLVKVLIVGGLILNGYLTSKNGSDTRKGVDKVQEAAAKQIRTIYANQNIWAGYAQATEEEHRLILEKLGVPKDEWPRLPPINIEKLNGDEEQGEGNNQ